MDELQTHHLANIFPPMDGVAFRDLVEDVRVNGLQEPIVLFEGAILDGRNRLRACHAAQVPARFKSYDGRDPLAFVISANLHRRHLDVSQRAMIAAAISEKKSGTRGVSKKVGATHAPGYRQRLDRRKMSRSDSKKISCDAAAHLMSVSPGSVSQAHKVIKAGIPKLIKAVESGEIAVSAAATISSFSKDQQDNILAAGGKAVTILAREEHRARRDAPSKKKKAPAVESYDYFKIGDGRSIGNIRVGELERLEQLMLVTAKVLRTVRSYFANPDHSATVRSLITEPKLADIVEAAWRDVKADSAESA